MVDEMKKRSKDLTLTRQKMDLTFSFRRKEILWMCSPRCRKSRRDGLLCNLKNRLVHSSIAKDALGQEVENLLDKLDEQTSDIAVHRKNTALEGLPLFVPEDSGTLFKTSLETDPDDETRGVKIGIVTVLEDDVAPTSLSSIQNIAVVLEERIVLTDLPDLPTAFVMF
ncbi:hypothetical protein AAFF_G00363040 [Aldrovandia affinis]|uniref:Uncharacterized protein n=1 Tax=Aldrovandia affinis TaxID=143900 RepID=A0AAD7VZE5_9TELE|nr:hypothetical protein AAFF_G00363040 [Aldrovandia affinis]